MTTLGMSDSEKLSIYTIVAGVLHLGNVMFEEEEGNKGTTVCCAVLRTSLDLLSFSSIV